MEKSEAMARAKFKSPSLDVASQPRDVCARPCTALKKHLF